MRKVVMRFRYNYWHQLNYVMGIPKQAFFTDLVATKQTYFARLS